MQVVEAPDWWDPIVPLSIEEARVLQKAGVTIYVDYSCRDQDWYINPDIDILGSMNIDSFLRDFDDYVILFYLLKSADDE